MLTTIPFSGFYNTIHESNIDYAISQLFADRDTGCTNNDGLESALSRSCDFRKVFAQYSIAYCSAFADEFSIPRLTFDAMESPKEYNFTTDRIFAQITLPDVQAIRAKTDTAELSKMVKEKFTSRDGFISFYSNSLDAWEDVSTWDHNQLGTLLECYANQENHNGDFDQFAESDIMESMICNGGIDTAINTATPDISRLYKIHEYLETRAHRGTT